MDHASTVHPPTNGNPTTKLATSAPSDLHLIPPAVIASVLPSRPISIHKVDASPVTAANGTLSSSPASSASTTMFGTTKHKDAAAHLAPPIETSQAHVFPAILPHTGAQLQHPA
ncbi:unnamed protein product [Sphagnum balticum]